MPLAEKSTLRSQGQAHDLIEIKRVVLFDPGLGPSSGHWFQFNDRIARELARRQVPVKVAGCVEQDPRVLESLPVEPVFRNVGWYNYASDPKENTALQAQAIVRDLSGIDQSWFDPETLVVMSTLFPGVFAGYLEWLRDLPEEKTPKAAFIFQFPEGTDIFKPNWPYINLFRSALPAYGGHDRLPNIRFFGCSESLAQRNSVIIGMKIHPLPMMAYHDDLEKLTQDPIISQLKPFDGVRVGYFGHASLEKGAQFLESIVQRAQTEMPNVQFILHLNFNPDTKEILEQLRNKNYPNVISFWGHLSESEITTLRNSVDLVFLPYNEKYNAAPSMVFTEAMIYGKPSVIPENTWMSYDAFRLGAPVVRFFGYDGNSMFAAIKEAVNGVKQLKELGMRTAPIWARRHSIQNFVSTMLRRDIWRETRSPDFGWSEFSL